MVILPKFEVFSSTSSSDMEGITELIKIHKNEFDHSRAFIENDRPTAE